MIEIVGDIGGNHNADINNAFKLIDNAKKAGFDFVKFQKRNPELYPERPYDSPVFGQTTYREHKRRLELSADDYRRINLYCNDAKMRWFASPFDLDSVAFLEQFDMPHWKIASPCALNLELVEAVAKQSGRVIISTGMQYPMETEVAISTLRRLKSDSQITILHCCSEYPTPLEHVNLRMIEKYRRKYIPIRIGYSSHDAGVVVPVAAATMGAEMIEVHITLDRAMPGSDHAASLEYMGMSALVSHIRAVETAKGDGIKEVYPGEVKIREKVLQTNGDS